VKRGISLSVIIIILAASFFEPRNLVSSYCAAIVLDVKDGEPLCGFVVASLDKDTQNISVRNLTYEGSFRDAIKALKDSDIRLFLPTVRGVFVNPDVDKEWLDRCIAELVAEKGMPLNASVAYSDDPLKLIEEKDGGTDAVGATFVPKLLKHQKRAKSLLDFFGDEQKKAPLITFDEGRFIIGEDTGDE